MSESAIVSKIQPHVKGLEVLPSPENHLPLDLHLQRMMATPPEEKIFYIVENDELIALNLVHAKLSSDDLGFLEEFPSLKTLSLTGGNLTEWELPENLASLEYLNLARNSGLKKVVFPVAFPHLKRLWLEECALKELVLQPGFSSLMLIFAQSNKLNSLHLPAGMDSVEFLDFKANKISEFKADGAYPKLWTLYLEDNELTELGAGFLDPFPALGRLRLEDNPLHESILSNIKEDSHNTLSFIKRYLKDLAKGGENDLETKVLLLGNGNVGKSCLVQRLVHNRFETEWHSTHAISLEQYPKDWGKEGSGDNLVDPYLLNLWDFGGQEIYHATHRLFMQTNAVYLLLWDHKTENTQATYRFEQGEERRHRNHGLRYWLSYAQSQGEDSPVMVVQTKIGRDDKQSEHAADIQKDFFETFSTLNFHYIESSDDNWDQNGYKELCAMIKDGVSKTKKDLEIPISWIEVRQRVRELQRAKEKSLELMEFYQLAEAVEEPTDVLQWLSQSGVFFYKEGLFNDEIILDQAWAIEAIYTLFDREGFYYEALSARKGEFSGKDLAKIWNKNSEAEQELFVSFMLSCELCFETTPKDKERYHTPFLERTFIAPQLLPPKGDSVKKLLELTWKDNGSLYFRFEHEFLHYGVIQSFIVRSKDLAKNDAIWKTGILLEQKGQVVQVEAYNQRVDIRGTQNALPLLQKIRKELQELQGKAAREYFSVDGQCYVSKQELEEQASMGNSRVKGYWGDKMELGDPIDVGHFSPFLYPRGGIEGKMEVHEHLYEERSTFQKEEESGPKLDPTNKRRVYLSYDSGKSRKKEAREKVVDDLFLALTNELPESIVLRDKMNLQFGGLVSEFLDKSSEQDLIIVFISDAYIKSAFCMFELYEIARDCKMDKDEFSRRVLTVPLEELDLEDPDVLRVYYKHWEEESAKWELFVKERMDKDNLNPSHNQKYLITKKIEKEFGEFVAWLADIHTSDVSLLSQNDYLIVKTAILARLGS